MTGGGTGGHVNPAIAIADKIKIMEPDSDIAFVGTPRGIENKIVPAAGYRLYHVDIRGLKRSFSLREVCGPPHRRSSLTTRRESR